MKQFQSDRRGKPESRGCDLLATSLAAAGGWVHQTGKKDPGDMGGAPTASATLTKMVLSQEWRIGLISES